MLLRGSMLFTLCMLTLLALATLPVPAQQATRPPATELMIWVRADDLTPLFNDGDRINRWPDAGGKKRHLTSSGELRPFVKYKGLGDHATVVFKGDARAEPKINHALNLPLSGEWRGITLFFVGANLASPGLFDSAPARSGCLRTRGFLQLTGTNVTLQNPFPPFNGNRKPGVITIAAGIDIHGKLTMTSYANGQKQGESTDANPLYSVLLRNPSIGNGNGGEIVFNGELAEALVYRGVISDEERLQTERYLQAKYGWLAPEVEAPEYPAGYTPPVDPEATPLPEVATAPVEAGRKFWMRVDDLFGKGLKEGIPIDALPNNAGDNNAVTSSGLLRPKYLPAGINRRPVLRFEGNNKADPKVQHYLSLPLAGEYSEVTIAVVGRNLNGAGVIDTAPGRTGCLRTMGYLQLTGSTLTIQQPFPLLALERSAQMIFITVGKFGDAGQYLETHANGHFQARAQDANAARPVLFRNPTIGTNNTGDVVFAGDIAEVLIFDRALTEDERKQTEAYFSEKWGIKISTPEQVAAARNARSFWSTRATQLPRTFSWLGNSFSGKTEWVQSGVGGISVFPDGTVIATSVWDEPHKEIGFYKDGKPVGPKIKGGSSKVVFDEQYLYVGMSGMGKPTAGIRRLNYDGQDVPWPELGEAKWPTFKTPAVWNEVQGLAVTATEIFVTAAGVKEIRVYDIATGAFKRSMPVDAGGALLLDAAGLLWLGNNAGVTQYTRDGTATGKKITGVAVGGLAFDPQGLLVVADSGARQQLIYFDVAGAEAREVKALLQRGGAWAAPNPGEITEDRLTIPNGLGIDAEGNLYVNGGGIISSYTPDGGLRWRIYSTVFCTCSDFDAATDGMDIYTGTHHYRYQPDQPAGKDWPLWGVTVDYRRFPEMAGRMSQSNILRRIGGRLYRFAIGIGVYVHMKEDDGSIFAPVAMYTGLGNKGGQFRPKAGPQTGRFAWSDLNGNGLLDKEEFTVPPAGAKEYSLEFYSYGIDEKGGIWEPLGRYGVRHTAIKEFTEQGAPVYDLQNQKFFPRPAEFSDILRSYYFAETDTMYLAGYTWDFPALGTEHWGNCGREVIIYDKWSVPAERTIRTRIPYPDGLANVKAISILDRAGLLFVGQMETSVIFVYNTHTGKLLGIVEPDQQIVGGVGWIDIAEGIRAFERQDGEILLLVEDSWAQKEMIYRIPASIKE